MSLYPWTGRLSYSLLKTIATSPADFRHACTKGVDVTASMRLGTCTHYSLLGGRAAPLVYEGDRRGYEWEALTCLMQDRPHHVHEAGSRTGTAWKDAKAAHGGVPIFLRSEVGAVVELACEARMRGATERDLYTASERAQGETIATAVRTLPHNRAVYETNIAGGEYEVPLEWEMGGFPMSTRGVDILHAGRRRVQDYKTARTVDRWALDRQANALHYAPQLAIYCEAVRQCLWEPAEAGLVVTSTEEPHCTVALPVRPAALSLARAKVSGWLTLLRDCLERDQWPGPPGWDLEPPVWEADTTGEDALEEAAS